jgi:tagaturonate reductase
MERLSYAVLQQQGYDGYLVPRDAPVKVLQFGEGNFLRAFVDYWIDVMNEKGGFNGHVQVVTPIRCAPNFDVCQLMAEQEGLYTLYLQGQEKGEKVRRKRVISSLAGCLDPYRDYQAFLDQAKNPELKILTSNTTEAGIAYDPASQYDQTPPASYPAKLCRFLHERWKLGLPGFLILACELIDHNGEVLRDIVLRHCDEWGLEPEFHRWVAEENQFCSTLVDRIVPGYPRSEAEALTLENGYEDRLMDTGEVFGFWVIEGPQWIRDLLPIEQAGLSEHIYVVDDHTPYKQRKVRILNGAHTSFVPGAYLAGQDIVRDCMADPVIRGFMEKCVYDEIIPTLTLPRQELLDFAASVADRFQNP